MRDKTRNSKNTKIQMMIAGVLLVCLAIVCIVGILIQGGTEVKGAYYGLETKEALACESDLVAYSLFDYDNSDSKNLRINATFVNDSLNSISLLYRLNYSSIEDIRISEAVNHAKVNEEFSKDEMSADSLDATYGIISDGLQFSIFTKSDSIKNEVLSYFMLDNVGSVKNLNKEKMAKIYTNMGLNCEIRYNENSEEVNEK